MKKVIMFFIIILAICSMALPADAGGPRYRNGGGCRGGNFGSNLAAAAVIGATAGAANALVSGIFGGGNYYYAPPTLECVKVCRPVGYRSVHCEWQCR